MLTQSCKTCKKSFTVTDEDLAFYDRVSPICSGEKVQIPPPTCCPDCRQQRRLPFRNERKLYSDQCDLCKKNIVSLYSPDKPYLVYCLSCCWSDTWDARTYGRDFDFSRSFFEQFKELQLQVPRPAIFNLSSVNSEYTNHSSNNKNCYMGVSIGDSEDCMYSHWLIHSKDCLDMLYSQYCEQCYECSYCQHCYGTYYSQYCENTRDCMFCFECKDSDFLIGCVQLQHQKYMILNHPVTKEVFEKTREEMATSKEKFQEMQTAFEKLKLTVPHRYANMVNCHNSTGNDMNNCKNATHSFNVRNCEDVKYMFDLGNNKDGMDCYEHGWLVPSELNYETHAGMAGYHLLFCSICSDSHDLMYSDICVQNCANLFGCVGLVKKEYCILNKQYSKEEYEKLVPRIIEYMKSTGEFGEFFPGCISPFGYNETTAPEYFPLSKEQACAAGFNWCDYESPIPNAESAMKCEVTGRPFKMTQYEIGFYEKNRLPLPRRHPDTRHNDRMLLRQPRVLFDRKCDKCHTPIATTFSPSRPEIIYCETCYRQAVY